MPAFSLHRACLVVGASAVLAACSSTPLQTPAPAAAAAPAQAATTAPANANAAAGQATPASTALAAHLDPNSTIARERSVYFEFDEALIPQASMAVIERQGQYLAKNGALQVRVEGNTDERGGSEYNLALGQRRADAVKKALQVYGVKDSQVETVSFGRERPKATGHDEAAWAQNRRADIVYPAAR
jgi:peptidoglycan-associated lipoprotein